MDGGLGVAPYARGTAELRVPLSSRLSVGLAADGDLGTGIALLLRAGSDPDLRTGLNTESPGSAAAGARMSVDLTLADPDGSEPVTVLAEDDISLTARSFAVTLTIDVSGESADAILRLAVAAGRFAVTSTGVSFLDDLLPAEGLVVDVDADLSYSSRDGLTLSGQASLTVARAVGLKLGPLTVNRYELSLGTSGGGIAAGLGVAATLTLGPVELSVAGVGVRATIEPGPGNLGAADLAVRAAPPNGFGVVIDAGVVTGGGFVQRDPTGDYIGALELQLGKIGIKAIGLLSTGHDWSMLLLLYAQIPPVQIGFGFTLEGLGGMLGVHRAVDVNQLVNGMRTGAFDDLLFPADPVGDAPRIIATLRQLFPMRRNTLTVGPMVDVHWGKPVIITARLAVLIQLDNALGGGPLALSKVVVIGQLRAAVGATEEDPEARVLVLIIDVLGFWDLAEKRYGFIAALRDSSVAGIDLTGGLAVWGEYGDHPSFLLAAGGFNPRFKDVPATVGGAVARLGASFSVGRFDLTLAGYFAVTPGDDPGRAQPQGHREDRAGRARGRDRLRRPDLPPPPHALHRRLPVLRRGHLPWAQSGRGQGGRHDRGSRAAGTSWGRSASRSSGGTSPSPSTSRGAPRHRWSANRSTSARCWPPSWPSRRTGPPRCPAAARPSSRWPRVGATSRREPIRSPAASSSSRPCRWAWPWTGSATRRSPGRTSSTSRG